MNTQFRRKIKLLLQAGLVIFSFTVVAIVTYLLRLRAAPDTATAS